MDERITIVEPSRGFRFAELTELVRYRETLLMMCWRDIAVRYKQSAIGVAWAVLQPVGTMVVFSVVFGQLVGISTGQIPYPVFTYCGLLPWLFFQRALVQGSTSLVNLSSVLTKVYFPRLIAPATMVLTGLFDFAIAFVVLVLMMLWYGIWPGWPVIFLPSFLGLAVAAALAISLWLSVANVEFRDVQHAIPFLVQAWTFATPIVYPASLVPEHWRLIYSLNPMVAVVEGFRWGLLGGPAPALDVIAMSVAVTAALLVGGLLVFDRFTRSFADRV
jgi:homopolymeric O-antigen transport system permease protein